MPSDQRVTVFRDILTLCGIGCIVVGLYLAWPPLAWLAGGAAMAAFGIGSQFAEWQRRKRESR